MKRREKTEASLCLPNLGGECEVIAAGEGGFGSFVPDPFTAYVRVSFGRALPQVIGPESISGRVFGIHPAVLARSYAGLVHKQVNMGHHVKYLGKKEDRICGCVLEASFPEEPEGGWVIADSVEDAPKISVVSALFKQAGGVAAMLGNHLAGKVKMSVSLEFTYYLHEIGIYDPVSRIAYDREEIPSSLRGFLDEKENGDLLVRRTLRQPSLIPIIGGVSGSIDFSGYGYVTRPAERSASIDQIAASRREAGQLVVGSIAAAESLFSPGTPVFWPGGSYGHGVVRACHFEGEVKRCAMRMDASLDDPVLEVVLPDGRAVLRKASSVKRKI